MQLQKLWLALASLFLLVAFPRVAHSQQVPKVGGEYKDEIRLGFSIKMPADWGFVPPQPGEVNSLGKYPGGDMSTLIAPKSGTWHMMFEIELLKFDRRKQEEPETIEGPDGKTITIDLSRGPRDFAAWAKQNLKASWTRVEKMCKTTATNKVPTKLHVYRNELDKEEEIAAYLLAWEYQLAPDLEIVMVATAPADDKRWNKWEGPLFSMAKSFKPLEIATKKIAVAKGNTIRDARRAELENEIKNNPGWKLYETPHYFLVTSKDDKDFMKELMHRLEAIHEVYEELYPPSLAAELRQLAKVREAAEAKEKKDEEKPEEMTPEQWEKEQARRTRAEQGDPMERAACSVVRVCKDRDEYHHYGGPGGSAGYWASWQEELVVYDDQTGGGRSNTWAVINHEALHQYVFYFFGNLSPHSWFNEGTGDFFSGYQLDGSKFKLKPFNWRLSTIKEALRPGAEKYAPLKDLVRWTQAEYYGRNKLGLDGGENYAQGWSFVYFLRTGKKNAKGWNPAWEPILDTYLRTLVETDDLTKAVDTAFAGVNWDELEACWKRYILSL